MTGTAHDQLAGLSLVEAADGIRSGEFSSRELVEASLSRIERFGTSLNCFIDVQREAALSAADTADQAVQRNEVLGSLHGVPLAHKDMFYRAGSVVTCGSKIRRDFRPTVTAHVLGQLDQAGALHLGALNMAEFAVGPTGHNVHYGDCCNPWSTDHITGGSSSGSGSSVAGRLVYGALGSDTGGSIRLPACACGLVGIKPTQTRVSRSGVMGLSFSLDNVGPLTRTVRDAARMLAVIAGHDPRDPTSSRHPVPDYEAACRDPDIRGTRIGRPRNYYFDTVTPEIQAAMDASLKQLAALGAEIVDLEVPDHENIGHFAALVHGPEGATLHRNWLRERPEDYGAQTRARLEPGLTWPATYYLEAQQLRPMIIQHFIDEVFAKCDAVFAPVLPMPIPSRKATDVKAEPGYHKVVGAITHCTVPANFLTLPSLALPATLVDGRPSGFQLMGPPFSESRLFTVGAAYEAVTQFSQRVPTQTPLD